MRTVLFALALLTLPPAAMAADPTYDVGKADGKGAAGAPIKASVTVKAKQGWHLNHEAPFTLKLTPPDGVATPKAKLVRADLAESTDTAARFDIPFTVAEPGKKIVEAEAGFVLCQADACRPVKEKVSIALDAAKAETAPAPKGKAAKKKS